MKDIWAIIVIVIIVMIIYGYVSTEISEYRKRKIRQKRVPLITDALKAGVDYNIYLSDGRKFTNVQIIGTIEDIYAESLFASWGGIVVVLKNRDQKRIYLKTTAIRFIEEV